MNRILKRMLTQISFMPFIKCLENPFISNRTVGAYCCTPLRRATINVVTRKFVKGFFGIHIVGIALGLMLFGQSAMAQFTQNPFFEHAEALAAAHGFESLELRLTALTEVDELDVEFAEEIESALERDLPRFQGTLVEQNADLATQLRETLENLLEALENNSEESKNLAAEALELTNEAREIVIPEDLAQTPAFSAALMTLLLLAEEGIAERFEETAAGEEAAYAGGWAAVQRVKEMWSGIESSASDTQKFEVNDMLRELDALFPSTEVPDEAALIDPEAAEDPAQRIAGFLEELADASLFPDRDMGQLILLTKNLVQSGCDSLETEKDLASQRLNVAGFYYAQYLGNTIGLLAPEPHAKLEPLWSAFAEESGEEEGAEVEMDCSELLESLEQIGEMFGI